MDQFPGRISVFEPPPSETPSSREVPILKTPNPKNRCRGKRRAVLFLSLGLGASLEPGVWRALPGLSASQHLEGARTNVFACNSAHFRKVSDETPCGLPRRAGVKFFLWLQLILQLASAVKTVRASPAQATF